ncbi:hypothetical protein EMPS_07646 [Entomortierella parvispora]|uniref:Phytocyanin domain-containing protein n=1 Tax=Entomortierella parvispora TaxID=205924 RepID=A0A9P3HFA9_9FUNG|nr:hypothetical protein EMPS_07646 [Entomortierella parvispora]
MKFAAVALVASAVAAVASADMLQIYNPTAGTQWTIGESVFIGWSGNCASMGAAGKNVTVDFNQGPADAVRFAGNLGLLDCSGASVRQDFTVPSTLTPGAYSIVVRTSPQPSYTNEFTILGAGGVAPSTPPTAASSAPAPTSTHNAAGSLTANIVLAAAGAVVVASQML